MERLINCFIPFESKEQVEGTVAALKTSQLVNKIYLLNDKGVSEAVDGATSV